MTGHICTCNFKGWLVFVDPLSVRRRTQSKLAPLSHIHSVTPTPTWYTPAPPPPLIADTHTGHTIICLWGFFERLAFVLVSRCHFLRPRVVIHNNKLPVLVEPRSLRAMITTWSFSLSPYLPESVVLNDFYSTTTETWVGAEQLLTQLAAFILLQTSSAGSLFCSSSRRAKPSNTVCYLRINHRVHIF